MSLLLKFHGALDEVLGSCSFIRHRASGRTYAIDCGRAHRREPGEEPALPANLPPDCRLGALDGLFITHAHDDHVGGLLRWLEEGFHGRIFCTAETGRLVLIACRDQAEHEYGDDAKRMQRLLTQALERAVICAPGSVTEVEPGLRVECFPTSHTLGCVAFRFSARPGVGPACSVLFTADVGPVERTDETGSMMPARMRPPASDYVVAESTYGDRPPREPHSRSCARRLERLAQVLERGLCDGAESKVFFPAFAMQRSQDVYLDVCHLLLFHRARIGLREGVVPRVYVDSNLARDFTREYLAAYERGLGARDAFVNADAAILQSAASQEGGPLALLRALMGFERKNELGLIRSPATRGGARIEVCWGAPPAGAPGPYVVICGKGATTGGRIVRYMRDHLRDASATFVLTGYAPARSPGRLLKTIAAPVPGDQAPSGIELPEVDQIVPAGEVRAAVDDIAEFYSGHADGPSLCRYVLGSEREAAGSLKGVFLVHGDRDARSGMARRLREEAGPEGLKELAVHLPRSGQGWFDCAQDGWEVPPTVEIALSLNIPRSTLAEEVLQLMRAQFGAGEWTIGPGNEWVFEIQAALAGARTTLRLRDHNAEFHRLDATTCYRGFRRLADLRPVFFHWKEVVNALGLDKPDHFAGHKLVRNESHMREFESLLRACLDQSEQRLASFIVAGRNAFDAVTLRDLELLLTPHTRLFVFESCYLPRVNAALFRDPLRLLSARNAFYVPLRFSRPALSLPVEFDHAGLADLLRALDEDRRLAEARSIALPKTSVPASPPSAPPGAESRQGQGATAALLRRDIPEADYEGLEAGLPEDFVIQKVNRRKGGGEVLFVIVRRAGKRATGILHRSNFGSEGMTFEEGSTIRAHVVSVDPSQRSLIVTLIPPAAPIRPALKRAEDFGRRTGVISWSEMAQELGVSFEVLRGLVSDHFKRLADGPADIGPGDQVPAGQEMEVFTRLSAEAEAGQRRARSIAPPDEGFTFAKMALRLGPDWTVAHILDVAAFFESSQRARALGREVLDANPGREGDAIFPVGRKDEFYLLCHAAAGRGWKDVPSGPGSPAAYAVPAPAGYSIGELAAAWGLPARDLAERAVRIGIGLADDKFIAVKDALRLRDDLSGGVVP